jgi:hypothetical protein
VLAKPFNVKLKDIDMQLGGTHGLDQTIDYIINTKLPRPGNAGKKKLCRSMTRKDYRVPGVVDPFVG